MVVGHSSSGGAPRMRGMLSARLAQEDGTACPPGQANAVVMSNPPNPSPRYSPRRVARSSLLGCPVDFATEKKAAAAGPTTPAVDNEAREEHQAEVVEQPSRLAPGFTL
jgi:hypothetical protein